MTLSEFKAWFEGFTECIEGKAAPTQKQWAKIKEKVGQIDGQTVTRTIYLDHYVNPWRPYWDRYWSTGGYGLQTTARFAGAVGGDPNYSSNTEPFDSLAAMNTLGRMEAVN